MDTLLYIEGIIMFNNTDITPINNRFNVIESDTVLTRYSSVVQIAKRNRLEMTTESQPILDQLVQEIKSISTKLDSTMQKQAAIEARVEAMGSNHNTGLNYYPGLSPPNPLLYASSDYPFQSYPMNSGSWGVTGVSDYNNIQLLKRNAMLHDIDRELTKLQGISTENMNIMQKEGITFRIKALQSMYVETQFRPIQSNSGNNYNNSYRNPRGRGKTRKTND